MRGRVTAVSSLFISASNELGDFESGVAARFPASILDTSRMSDTSRSRVTPDEAIRATISDWSGDRGVRDRASTMPITPFRGVRISWLILARNSDLAQLAASAAALASIRSRSAATLSVTSRATA